MNPAPPVTRTRIGYALYENMSARSKPGAPARGTLFRDQLPVQGGRLAVASEPNSLSGLFENDGSSTCSGVIESVRLDRPFAAPQEFGPHRLLEQRCAPGVCNLLAPLVDHEETSRLDACHRRYEQAPGGGDGFGAQRRGGDDRVGIVDVHLNRAEI